MTYFATHRCRGLTSESGQNNCFLNVIIQSLWHLGCFRGALLTPGRPAPRGPASDRRVLDALINIFRAFAAVRVRQLYASLVKVSWTEQDAWLVGSASGAVAGLTFICHA